MKEFFGIDGFTRTPEGFFSWQHITFVTSLMVAMVVLAACLGRKNQGRDAKTKNAVLIWAALLIDGFEIFKIVLACAQDPTAWKINLPLFLCSIQLITIPLAAFAKGKLREAALDFVLIFGLLGGVLGTVGAGQNYNAYPVLSLDNVASGVTHCISGFASLYIGLSGMGSLKKQNAWITYTILGGFCIPAYIANVTLGTNYMFLMQGDGTPYDILYNLLGGSPVLYPIAVVFLFVLYISVFYGVVFWNHRKKSQK